MEALLILIPFFVTLVTELAKIIPQIPVTSKNAKRFALIVAIALVVLQNYSIFNAGNAVYYAAEVGIIYASAVGFYETLKKGFQSFESYIKSL